MTEGRPGQVTATHVDGQIRHFKRPRAPYPAADPIERSIRKGKYGCPAGKAEKFRDLINVQFCTHWQIEPPRVCRRLQLPNRMEP